MRNLSFWLTKPQVLARTKTVTRRRGDFWFRVLQQGSELCAVEKSQGIPKGGLVRLCTIRVLDVKLERLDALTEFPAYGRAEAVLEGFPDLDGAGFVEMFCRHMRCEPDQLVTRIHFEYPDLPLGR